MQTVLQLSHISFAYGKKQILNDLSFQLHPGEIVSFLGVNGAGKKKSILFSTHILSEVTRLCSRVLLLHQGKLVADEQLDAHMDSAYINELFKAKTK